MGSPFKMKYSGVPALLKTLTPGQEGMIDKMASEGKTKQANAIKKGIEAAPAQSYGTKDAAMKMTGNGGKKDSIIGAKKGYKDIEKKDPDVFTKTYNAATGMTHPNGQGYDYNKREAYKKNAISKYGSMANARAYYQKMRDKN